MIMNDITSQQEMPTIGDDKGLRRELRTTHTFTEMAYTPITFDLTDLPVELEQD